MRKGTFTKAKLGFIFEEHPLSLLISGLFRNGPTVTSLSGASGFVVGPGICGMFPCEADLTVDAKRSVLGALPLLAGLQVPFGVQSSFNRPSISS